MSYPVYSYSAEDGQRRPFRESRPHIFEIFEPGQKVEIIISPPAYPRLAGFYSLYQGSGRAGVGALFHPGALGDRKSCHTESGDRSRHGNGSSLQDRLGIHVVVDSRTDLCRVVFEGHSKYS